MSDHYLCIRIKIMTLEFSKFPLYKIIYKNNYFLYSNKFHVNTSLKLCNNSNKTWKNDKECEFFKGTIIKNYIYINYNNIEINNMNEILVL